MTRADGWKFLPQQCVLLQLTASAALLVFRCDLAICAQRSDPSGRQRASLIWSCLFFAIMTISPKNPLSAFRIISITLFLLIFLSTPENVLQLAWNSTLGGFASKRCPRNSPYAFSLTTFAFNRYPCALLVVIHTRYYCSVLNGFIQLLLSKAISDFTSAASLFASLVLWRSVCSELDLFRSTSRSLGCLKKYFDLQQLLK